MASIPQQTPSSQQPGLLSIDEAAAFLGVSVRSVKRLIAERRLEFIRVGRSIRFRLSGLERFAERNAVAPINRRGGAA